MDPTRRALYVDWKAEVEAAVGIYRAAYAHSPHCAGDRRVAGLDAAIIDLTPIVLSRPLDLGMLRS